jgi:mono/diheme cytochrome c family protein
MKQIFPAIALAAFTLTSCAQIKSDPNAPKNFDAATGRALFLKNCAHCHSADAHGDEGPDLHDLDWTDKQITARIRNGKKGQMTAFAGKLAPEEITTLVAYVRTLK